MKILNFTFDKVFYDNRGLSIVELMIALFLLMLVLMLGFSFYQFGTRAFNSGEIRADIQQNARMIAEYITKEIRVAEVVGIYDDKTGFTGADYDYFLFYLDNDLIKQKNVEVLEESGTLAEVVLKDIVLLESIADNVDFDISFSKSSADSNILMFTVKVTDRDRGDTFILDTEVLILNSESIIDNTSDGLGTAIFYQVPAPPAPSILGIALDPSSIEIDEFGNTSSVELKIEVFTYRVDDDESVSAFMDLGDNGVVDNSGVIANNYAAINISVPKNLPVGSYNIDVIVDNEGNNLIYSRLFEVFPYTSAEEVSEEEGS